ncbi:hypothetical protein [Helicobacter turcicus]|uniref:Uncharacterized protein n=1 Tax=Helicobacter turcicus TaxID=2867412 RepID=A0ABS7JQ35_9HELI|nr:hypothetical protein [Helicobacter turcicus]MBX7491472.1 hypothetical protein [Helicobacter turcicus]MBX7546329.1 hypothetical protein [Helicobacter turcicus]
MQKKGSFSFGKGSGEGLDFLCEKKKIGQKGVRILPIVILPPPPKKLVFKAKSTSTLTHKKSKN